MVPKFLLSGFNQAYFEFALVQSKCAKLVYVELELLNCKKRKTLGANSFLFE